MSWCRHGFRPADRTRLVVEGEGQRVLAQVEGLVRLVSCSNQRLFVDYVLERISTGFFTHTTLRTMSDNSAAYQRTSATVSSSHTLPTHLSSQLLRQCKWKTCPHPNFFGVSFTPLVRPVAPPSAPPALDGFSRRSIATISSRQITQLPPPRPSISSCVASGYRVSILRVARRYLTRSRHLAEKARKVR